jgi:hypothetical protein
MTNAFSTPVKDTSLINYEQCSAFAFRGGNGKAQTIIKKQNLDVLGSYNDSMCYWNAEKNLATVFADCGLKRVCGSVAFNGWFEYGGLRHTLKDFKAAPNDSHCWLEDDEGNVYDYAQPSWDYFARVNGHEGKMPLGVEFRGMSKEWLKANNLHYVPAPANAQAFLLNWADKSSIMKMMASTPWTPAFLHEKLCGF